MVQRVVDAALDGETSVVRPWLGVKGEPLTAEEATRLGLDRPRGLKVTDLFDSGPAARAGIRAGDVIVAVGGNEINDQGGLNFRVGTRAPGDTVAVTLLRDGRERIVFSWEVTPPQASLAPGESMTINEAMTDVPRSAVFADIGWAPR